MMDESQPAGTLANLASAGLELESDDERYERLKGTLSSDLRSQLFWYNLDSPTAYRLLVERGEVARQDARSNLLDRFEAFRKESLDRVAIEQGNEAAALYLEKFRRYDSLFTNLFTAAALSALERDPTAEDAEIARRLLDDWRTRPAATRIIARVAAAADIDLLVELADRGYQDERNLLLETLRTVAAGDRMAAKTLLGSKSLDVRRVGLEVADTLPQDQAMTALLELLLDPDERLRVEAVLRLRDRMTSAELESLLDEYIGYGRYFYNVVTWIDRILYARGVVLAYYEEEFNALTGR
jgi:hypothetical protein